MFLMDYASLNGISASIDPFSLILFENWLIKEAKLVEKAALQLALKEQKLSTLEQSKDALINRREIQSGEFGDEDVPKDNDNNNSPFLTRCGITWHFLANNVHQTEFDKLRRTHQVSKNRHVGYGIRYACTRNAKARDNCPYLMLCKPNPDGSLKVYYRNTHTHPIRQIRARERRRDE